MQVEKVIRLALLLFSFAFFSCKSDKKEEPLQPKDGLSEAKALLSGDIVLSSRATLNGVDRTLLPQGCPTKFNFRWEEDTMTLSLIDFTVGNMPFSITFVCQTKFMKLNSWEEKEYPDDGWVKFKGTNAAVTSGSPTLDKAVGSGAGVEGYLNTKTQEIEFIINYNMMNVRSEVFRQRIDKSRLGRFEEEFAQYERDLKAEKERQGL